MPKPTSKTHTHEAPGEAFAPPISVFRRCLCAALAEGDTLRQVLRTADPAEVRVLAPGTYVSRETIEGLAWLIEIDPVQPELPSVPYATATGWRLAAVEPDDGTGAFTLRFATEAPGPGLPAAAAARNGVFCRVPAVVWDHGGAPGCRAALKLATGPLVRLRVGANREGGFILLAEST